MYSIRYSTISLRFSNLLEKANLYAVLYSSVRKTAPRFETQPLFPNFSLCVYVARGGTWVWTDYLMYVTLQHTSLSQMKLMIAHDAHDSLPDSSRSGAAWICDCAAAALEWRNFSQSRWSRSHCESCECICVTYALSLREWKYIKFDRRAQLRRI